MTEKEEKSRSQIKREMRALQELGERLVNLPPAILGDMDLPEELAEAVALARKMTKRGARKRQLHYIGALMRRVDPEPIQNVLNRYDHGHQVEAWAFKQTESWRDRLVQGDDALLDELTYRCPEDERPHLHDLVQRARRYRESPKGTASGRALFRFLRTHVTGADTPD